MSRPRRATLGPRSAQRGRWCTWLLSPTLSLALASASPHAARASDSLDVCLSAYEDGQRLRHAGDLVGAAEQLLVCGGPACPVRMQGDCQRWLDAVERATPAIVFRVRDGSGALLTNVIVTIDGAEARRLDGRALPMNPGEHVIVFERAGFRPLSTPVFVMEGEKLEPREVTLQPLVTLDGSVATEGAVPEPLDADRPAPPPEARSLGWPLAFGGVALAGAVGFAYFGMRAKSGETNLEECTPNCTQARVDSVKQDYLWSNVSLAVGLSGLLGAGLFLWLDQPPATGMAGATPRHALQLGPTTRYEVRF